jgi:(p)ppGpp synthase/HD superfamily hydrolase
MSAGEISMEKIIAYATEKHAGQFRRDEVTPYIEHPLRVMRKLQEKFPTRPILHILGVLHDVLEDTDATEEELKVLGLSGHTIRSLKRLTHNKGEPYRDYISRIGRDPNARKVKLADIFDNITDSPTEKQFNKYIKAYSLLLIFESGEIDA